MKKTIFFFSSNARRKYLLDVIEAVNAPRKFVVHLRYRRSYLDPELWDLLPIKGTKEAITAFSSFEAILCYLYQEKQHSADFEWNTIYPLRFVAVKEAYKTGDGTGDIAHFYVSLENYCSGPSTIPTDGLAGTQYTCLRENHFSIKQDTGSQISAFARLVDAINPQHIKPADSRTKLYYPVFCYFDAFLTCEPPVYKPGLRRSVYTIVENKEYWIDASLRLIKPPEEGTYFQLKDADDKISIIPKQIPVDSSYDDFTWRIVPTQLTGTSSIVLSLESHIEAPEDYEILQPQTYLFIEVKSNVPLRLFSLLDEIALIIGTFVLAYGTFVHKTTMTSEKNDFTFPWIQNICFVLLAIAIIFKIAKVFSNEPIGRRT